MVRPTLIGKSIGLAVQSPSSPPVVPVEDTLLDDVGESILAMLQTLIWVGPRDVVDQAACVERSRGLATWREAPRTHIVEGCIVATEQGTAYVLS